MLVEYNKYNAILYLLTGITISVGFKRWIYGILILFMGGFILLQALILQSGDSSILKYQNYTKLPSLALLLIIILVSLFILGRSTIGGQQKLLSIIFLLLSIGFSLSKYYLKDKPLFSLSISNYISSLLLMIVLVTVAIIPDNQDILEREYLYYKNKIY